MPSRRTLALTAVAAGASAFIGLASASAARLPALPFSPETQTAPDQHADRLHQQQLRLVDAQAADAHEARNVGDRWWRLVVE